MRAKVPQPQPDYFPLYELPTTSLNDEPCSSIAADLLHPETVANRYGIGAGDLAHLAGIELARCTIKRRGGPYFPYDLYDRRMLARWEATSMVDDLEQFQIAMFRKWAE